MPTARLLCPTARLLCAAHRARMIVAAALLPALLAACGGSSSHTRTPTTPSGATTATKTSLHASLTGQNHNPVAGKNWKYTVTATDSHGHPVSGTVETEFAFQGNVVGHESPPTHPLKHGVLKDMLQFPAQSVGYPIELQVVVHTHLGSVTLDWPVTVHK